MVKRLISTWTRGDVLDYMTWRRETGRLEVTIRKDILAGRQLAEFAIAHGWITNNPFVGIEVPSDRDSLNEFVLAHERTLRRWLPWFCLKGVELADAREILKVLLGIDARELSVRELAAFQRDWTREFEQWQVRDLAGRQYDCFWMAGVTVPTRIEPGGPSILVVFGADRHSSPELVGLRAGRPESGKDWGKLLADLKRRGVSNGPKLAVGDVAQGALRALRAEFGQTGIQIGWRRESLNRLGVIPSDRRSNARSQANALFAAAKKADTGGDVNRIAGRCGAVGCEASEHSRQARDQLLTSHGSSDSQWERLRSFEVIDEVFATVRTETPMANRNLDPETALAMAYQVVLLAHQDDRNHHDGPSIL